MNLMQKKWAIYMEGALGERNGKMGDGVLRFGPQEIVCIIDSRHVGKLAGDVLPLESEVPVVGSLEEALALGAEVLLLGIAPSGGRLPEEWETVLRTALTAGLSLVNGLHDRLRDKLTGYLRDPGEQVIWDIRHSDRSYPIGTAKAAQLGNKRVLMIGTDMAVGKMTSGLLLQRWLLDQGVRASFVATGQVGITITGKGIPLDAIKVDQACGAVEEEVLSHADSDLVIVEGQGSLAHPGSTATLPLLRGTCPTHLILCHRAETLFNEIAPRVPIPPLDDFIRLNQDVADILGGLPRPQAAGIFLNTSHLEEDRALRAIAEIRERYGLPVCDPVRQGPAEIGHFLLHA